ncbi:hypothetical protein [Kineococcus sp. SYSU DK001]|uniref:hypothetical protein n=1 Tax=Kineococcus sp. SYSU DK001 TaxID=3383122 RepID=UPI003D7D2A67
MDLSAEQVAALTRSISPVRLGTYLTAAGGSESGALDLYLWDRRLSVAFLADLALLEVALRNAMNARLTSRWGAEWFADLSVPLDDRSSRQLAEAWSRISGEKTPGRVVAQCMFGFWRGLLDKGDHVGRPPRRVRSDYEVLWRGVLDKAFPGGKAQARADGLRWERAYALAVVSRINDLRNRVAHHEPLVNGFPLSGQNRRVSPEQAYADCLRLAAMLDRDLHALLVARSDVPAVLTARPTGT